jgi:hypothetical protein
MSSSVTRNGIGDEQRAWAEVCDGLPDIGYNCDNYGLGVRLRALVAATRRGTVRISSWHQLRADLADALDEAEDFAGRGDDDRPSGPVARSSVGVAPGYVCPRQLCDRRYPATTRSAPPCCELFGVAMVLVGVRRETERR